MILFDSEQAESAAEFPQLRVAVAGRKAALPVRATLGRFLRLAQTAVKLRGEVTVLLTTDAGIRSLNRRFRHKNKATDVLSFPVEDRSWGQAGDLAISVDTAARQAAEHNHSLGTEMKVLILHGLLHLAGHDHEADEGQMRKLEANLSAKLGLRQGLIARVEPEPAKTAKTTKNAAAKVVKKAAKTGGAR